MRYIRQSKIYNQCSRFFICIMVMLYLVGSLQIDSFHRLIHKHQREVIHTPEVESNGCHIALFHNQGKGSCAHPTHFSEDKKCPWCFASFQTSYLHSAVLYLPHLVIHESEIILYNLDYHTEFQKQNPARAPPVC